MLTSTTVNEVVARGAHSLGFHGKLVLELGPGGGVFALALARRNPHDFHVLIDMNRHNATRVARSIRGSGLTNIDIIHGVAHQELGKLGADVSFDRIHCHFPSPFNGINGNGHRLYDPFTCQEILRLTEPGAELFAVSDKRYAIAAFKRNLGPAFQAAPWLAPLPPLIAGTVIGTENEQIYCLNRGMRASRLRLVRG